MRHLCFLVGVVMLPSFVKGQNDYHNAQVSYSAENRYTPTENLLGNGNRNGQNGKRIVSDNGNRYDSHRNEYKYDGNGKTSHGNGINGKNGYGANGYQINGYRNQLNGNRINGKNGNGINGYRNGIYGDRNGKNGNNDMLDNGILNGIINGKNGENLLYSDIEEGGDGLSVFGNPGVDFPIYDEIPETEFQCSNQIYPGFYADMETRCQVFHVCHHDGRQHSFLCPNATIFSQQHFVCSWWHDVKCEEASGYYDLNKNIYQELGSTSVY